MSTKKNFGTGFGFLFHGAFNKKSDAMAKEKSTPGSFVKFSMTKHGGRYLVMSPRTNPPKRRKHKAKNGHKGKKNPGELVVLGLGGNPKKKSRKRGHAKAKTRARARRRPNASPMARAREMFSKFHGRQASGVFEMQRSAKARKDYTILGPLVAIGINAEKFDQIIRAGEEWDVEQWDALPHLCFIQQSDVNKLMRVLEEPGKYLKGVPLLATSPNGKQLYVISQEPLEIDVTKFDTDAAKDFVDLGEATFVNYVAQKPNDPKEWIHTFGEEGGTRPRLVYDKLNKVPMFAGGSYRVEAPGIVN
jgi:hypothetical protein